MTVIDDLLAAVPTDNSRILDVRIGAAWTAVVAEVAGARRCGLAATLSRLGHDGPSVRDAGHLHELSSRELCELARSSSQAEVSVGMAAINALLPRDPSTWVDINASELLAERGADKAVALVGHFPFVDWLRARVKTLWVLEQEPQAGDLPASAAAEVIPQADFVALTSMTLLNHTFDSLMALRRPDAPVMLLGPSTPLAPLLFDRGVQLLSGAVVEEIDAVLHGVSQGAGFRQLHRLGVRLVTMART
ncbi:MAG TPA: DUF364 domain-containing protein [Anaerolineae bacterium]|nr:DUF364 domain-containing protein [Anaerolineae bacterium]